MEELLVLSNPRKRRRKHKAKAHRRGKRRMSALQRQYFGGARANPKRRRGRRKGAARAVRRYSRRGRSAGRFMSGGLAGAQSMLKPALVGAVGAVGTNFVLSQLSGRGILPATLMTGKTRFLTQGMVAILLGMAASKLRVVGAGTARQMAEGALTVTLANAITEVANDNGLSLSGMGYYLPGINAGMNVPSAGGAPARMAGMGKYVSGPGSGVAGLARGNVTPMRRFAGAGNINTFRF